MIKLLKSNIIILCLMFSCNITGQTSQEEDKVFVEEFYSWYLGDQYPNNGWDYFLPDLKKVGDKKYIYDFSTVRNKFISYEVFTDTFIINDSIKVANCNSQMMNYDWDYEPEPEFNINACNFLWRDRICGGVGEFLDQCIVGAVISESPNTRTFEVFLYENNKCLYKIHIEIVSKSSRVQRINSIETFYVGD